MYLIILFLLNLFGLFVFLRLARRRAILDIPNDRSSHTIPTIRGGGLLFAPTFIALLLLYYPEHYWSAVALFLAGGISFWDDLREAPVRLRLAVHFLAVLLLIYDTQAFWPWWAWMLALVLITGWLNAFNFMDGINGITAVYGGVFLLSLWLNTYHVRHFFSGDPAVSNLIGPGMIAAILAFAFFNFRRKALCFAGDIGSIALALIIAWMFLLSWQAGSNPQFYLLAFPALYAVDSVMTILVRLAKGENIFEAHRSHLYQLLVHKGGWGHRRVALLYGGGQACVNLLVGYQFSQAGPISQLTLVVILYVTLCGVYFLCRKALAPGLATLKG